MDGRESRTGFAAMVDEQDGDYRIEPLDAEIAQRMTQLIVEAQEGRRRDVLRCKGTKRAKS